MIPHKPWRKPEIRSTRGTDTIDFVSINLMKITIEECMELNLEFMIKFLLEKEGFYFLKKKIKYLQEFSVSKI